MIFLECHLDPVSFVELLERSLKDFSALDMNVEESK